MNHDADDLRRIEISLLIDELRREEGDSVNILCDNPDGPPNNAVECCGFWTEWKNKRFEGETLLDCLRIAARESREVRKLPPQKRLYRPNRH